MLLLLLKSMANVSLALEDTHPTLFSHSNPKTQFALERFLVGLCACSPQAKLETERWTSTVQGPYIGYWQPHFFCSISCCSSVQRKTMCLSRDFCWKELVRATYRNRKFFSFVNDFKTDSPHDRRFFRGPLQSASQMSRHFSGGQANGKEGPRNGQVLSGGWRVIQKIRSPRCFILDRAGKKITFWKKK